LNSVATGRRLALRAAAWQLLAALLVAVLFLLWGPSQALAAALGAGAMLAGGLAAARLAFGGGVLPAGAAMLRLVMGLLVKWLVVFAVLAVGIGVWQLPPLPLVAGLVAGLVAQVLAAASRR